ncbi:MAG: AmmeMemoRadiSam system protein B [Pseudomonadales bacterium]
MSSTSTPESNSSSVFPPQVAGRFYPADAGELAISVDTFMATARQDTKIAGRAPKAIIAPHAGHVFSGSTAAKAYAHLAPAADSIRRVVMLGPAHRLAFKGLALPSASHFGTPLGDIAIDKNAISSLTELSFANINEAAFNGEHCLEVHLPFLQRILRNPFSIVPIIVGAADANMVAAAIDTLWGGDDTLILISSDLSHFHGYNEAQQRDMRTRRAIEALDINGIEADGACGRLPVSGLLALANSKGLRPTTLHMCNSGDTGADKQRVVGYGSWKFDPIIDAETPATMQRDLISVAAQAIDYYGKHQKHAAFVPNPPEFQYGTLRATFITLTLHGQLRGCIGSLQAHQPLRDDVARNAVAAAFHDGRFKPLTAEEFVDLDIGISVLSHSVPMSFSSEQDFLSQLVPGEDGIILNEAANEPPARSTFLPIVWESLPSPAEFVRQLKLKAGLAENYWSETLSFRRYRAEKFSGSVPDAVKSKAQW